jgi:hypothetical protein
MRFHVVVVCGIVATLISVLGNGTSGQDAPKLAREGVGLLPEPTETPATLGGTPPANPFVSDPSGGFSRIVFQTDESPDFKIIIRDYAILPDQQTHTLSLPSGALLHVLSGQGNVRVGQNRLELTTAARTMAPPGATLNVENSGKNPVVVRALILEAK